jgi:hypothetical protein
LSASDPATDWILSSRLSGDQNPHLRESERIAFKTHRQFDMLKPADGQSFLDSCDRGYAQFIGVQLRDSRVLIQFGNGKFLCNFFLAREFVNRFESCVGLEMCVRKGLVAGVCENN